MKPLVVSSAACAALLVALSTSSAFAAETLTSGAEAAAAINVTDVAAQDGAVSGVLVNRSQHTIKDAKLIIHHSWLWKNERHPESDSPGRVDYYVVQGQIAPGGRMPFTYRIAPPLPQRSDGRFTSSVEVVSFTEIGE